MSKNRINSQTWHVLNHGQMYSLSFCIKLEKINHQILLFSLQTQQHFLSFENDYNKTCLVCTTNTLCPKGAFNNYVEQILPNSNHQPPRMDTCGHTRYLLFFHVPSVDFLLTTCLPCFVHVVMECP